MILCMVNINKKANVISFPNDYGTVQFDGYLQNLGNAGKASHDKRVQLAFLVKALDYMQYVEFTALPTTRANAPFYATLDINVDGITYSESFELIKPLARENIFELRINLQQFNWRFRGIFFPYSHNTGQFYCFVFPFEKQKQVQANLTDTFRDRASTVYYDLLQSPLKYQPCFV